MITLDMITLDVIYFLFFIFFSGMFFEFIFIEVFEKKDEIKKMNYTMVHINFKLSEIVEIMCRHPNFQHQEMSAANAELLNQIQDKVKEIQSLVLSAIDKEKPNDGIVLGV